MDVIPPCEACGAANPADARFCGSCGAELGATCPSCGRRNPPSGRFCLECGNALGGPSAEPAFASREAFMPAPLADKLRAGSSSMEGERKLISVLFADVVGYTAMSERTDPEDMRRLMRDIFDVMLDAVHRFEGTVAQLLGDGLLALFGAPIAHEDHALRAILAGLALQEGLRAHELPVEVRVGIHSGLVVFGQIGTDLEFTFQAVGDTVNTASRVQGLAPPGTVVVSEATHRLAEGYVVFDDLGAHEVKNKAEPVHVFQAIRQAGSRSRVDVSAEHGLGPYVGRATELATLQELFDEVAAGRGQVAFVSGEAGLGKSRLVHEFRERLGTENLWLLGRCISYGVDIPYVPIVDLMRRACGVEEADPEDVIAAKLSARVHEVGGDEAHLPYLRFLLSIDPGDARVLEEDKMLRKPRVLEAFRDVLLAATERQPAVVVIEDLHWIDPPSAELLSLVIESVPEHRLLLVLTHRPDHVPPFGERPFYTRLALEPLSERDTIEVAQGASGDRALPPELESLIYRKAEGNPFFIEEVTKSLVESGDLVHEGEGYVLGRSLQDLRVPDTVQDVIMARLDRLDEEPRHALQTASVIGREFTSRLLERTAGRPTTAEAVAQLKAVQLIFERSLYPELIFMFKHALTHEVAYGSLLLDRRRTLHSAVGDAIRELYADRPAEVVETLAHHYERAERWDDAVGFLVASADKAMAGFALEQALGYADRALAAVDQASQPADPSMLTHLHFVRGQCYELRNEWEPAIGCYRSMADAAEATGDEVTRGFALAFVALAQVYAHDFPSAVATARRASAVATETGDQDLQAISEMADLFTPIVAGRLDDAYPRIDALASAGRAASDAFAKALCLDLAGEMLHFQSREAESAALIEEALAIAEDAQVAQPLQYVYFDLALVRLALGDYDEAFAAARSNIALCERVGDQGFWWCRAKNTLGRIHIELGDFERGALHNNEAVERALTFGDLETLRNAQLNLGDCILGSGDAEAARAEFVRLETGFDADTDPGEWMKWRYSMHLWVSMSQTLLILGEPDRALAYADRCLVQAEDTGTKRYISKGHRARALVLSSFDRHDDALAEIDIALTVADAIGGPEPRWRALGARAAILALAGRADEAADTAASALGVIDGIVEALAEPGAGEILLGSADVAKIRALL